MINKRSFVKTITFRIAATIATVLVVLIVTGDFVIAGTVGIIGGIVKTLIYYVHERVWSRVRNGKLTF